jgi:hypothetical protein
MTEERLKEIEEREKNADNAILVFTKHARQDVPDLIAEVRRLKTSEQNHFKDLENALRGLVEHIEGVKTENARLRAVLEFALTGVCADLMRMGWPSQIGQLGQELDKRARAALSPKEGK